MTGAPVVEPRDVEWKWNQLLDYIEAGLVVPLVGRELLWTTIDGEARSVPAYLARKLAERARMEWTGSGDPDPINSVVQQILASGTTKRHWHYTSLSQLLKDLEPTAPPAAFLKLAELPFRLFVSTTVDTYLERALNAVRYDGRPETIVPRYALGSQEDLPDRAGGAQTVVFPLLGRANSSPDYALTDEDVLEFVHQFHTTGTPHHLLETLRQRHLLLIGGGFSDWLLRFLVRLAKPGRLWTSSVDQHTLFVADHSVSSDANLFAFLQHPLGDTEIFPTHAPDRFVDELHQRWTARHPSGAPAWTSGSPRAPEDVREGGVFLSYCRQDQVVARRVRDAIHHAGIDVWFDETDLQAGDEYDRKIASQIARSYFFIAIVSRQTLLPEHRYFRVEWRAAETQSRKAPFDLPYILPIAIDDTPVSENDDRLPASFHKVQWTRAPGGALPEAFVKTLVSAYRRMQRPGP